MDIEGAKGMKALRGIVTAAALALCAAPADAALCVKKSGAVVARATCKPKEAVVTADVFAGSPGPVGAPGAKGDKGDKGEPAGFRVIDSSGRDIGMIDIYSDMAFAVPNGPILNVVVGPDGFAPYDDEPELYHEEPNCTGTAYVSAYPGDGFVYYPEVYAAKAYYPTEPVAEHTFYSYEYPAETCSTVYTQRGFCCQNASSPYTFPAGPVRTFDMSTVGTPPFTIVR
jgi:hypothetical protein